MRWARSIVLMVLVAAACGQERIAVVNTDELGDYNQGELVAAVDKFVAARRTPEAYANLSSTVLALRGGMDRTVGNEAELKLIVLALAPLKEASKLPLAEHIDTLATTVWPTLLAPRIEADAILIKRDPKAADWFPKPGEKPRDYLQRLCGDLLAGDCKQVVPEHQGAIVGAVATRRGMERARNAVSDCMACGADPQWHEAVRSWEELDRVANGWIHEIERKAHPDNWPIAGNASEPDPKLPEAFIDVNGELVVGDEHFGPRDRVEALRRVRGGGEALTLNLRPELSLAQVKAILTEVKLSGAKRVAVLARAPQYPWERRVYWLADGGKIRANLRPTDSLQLLLHTLDHVAGPGATARVD